MKQGISIRQMAQTAIFVAILAALSQIALPMPSGMPVTLQTFAVALCGFVLGTRMSGAAVGVYILIGAIGLPVFSGFNGGFGALVGITGGFIWGFVPFAMLCGLGSARKSRIWAVALSMLGLCVCHALGVAQFSLVTGSGLVSSAALVSAPYLIKDALSVIGARLAAIAINRAVGRKTSRW